MKEQLTLEQNIKDVIAKKMNDGTVEKLIEQQLEKGVSSALNDLFGSYGDITRIIKDKIKSVMIPYLENHDYSEYIVKLDDVLTEVLKHSTLDNKSILSNFKEMITPEDDKKEITVLDLFNKWRDYVSKEVETDGLEVVCDDGDPYYESVDVDYNFEEDERRSWSKMQSGVILFECKHDEKMNFEIKVHRWKDIDDKDMWNIDSHSVMDLNSLRHLNEIEVYIMKLSQHRIKIKIDTEFEEDCVEIEKEPDISFN